MSKFHSTVSRRTFMKGLGLAGAGLGATAAAAPVFRDLDELIAAPTAGRKLPWYVKEVDEPTTEIDWNLTQPYDQRETFFGAGKNVEFLGQTEFNRLVQANADLKKQGITNNVPGDSLRDWALQDASGRGFMSPWACSFLGAQTAITPTGHGAATRYQGTPEENSRMIRNAAMFFGAARVGFAPLDEHTKKLVYSYDRDNRANVFRDVEEAEQTDTERIIPNRFKWVISFSTMRGRGKNIQQMVPRRIGDAPRTMQYWQSQITQGRLQAFLRGLGYQGLGSYGNNNFTMNPAMGLMAGLGELGRFNMLLSHDYGGTNRMHSVLTDLPLEPTKPIDAGINKFCEACMKCADNCPGPAISFDKEPYWEVKGTFNHPGRRTWYVDFMKCYPNFAFLQLSYCSICAAVCPFSKTEEALIHDIVKGTIAVAGGLPGINDFMRVMDDFMGYGVHGDSAFVEEWWNADEPGFGFEVR